MKPIKLEIKGLNSFVEKQVVEFDKLTDRGLFGIFGPTGSGKSTILDGITLALYGDIARKSTNYINTNCDFLYVSYEFQVTCKEVKRYRVCREFKRDKNGGIRSKSSKIVDITGGIENVLEDKAKAVTSRCKDIIGLEPEDFMRTVVLPQGKFSEFLKLEGKDRRNMLERLFNLKRYGDDLSNKLSLKVREEKDKMNVLEGQLKGYEEVSKEDLKEKKEEIKKLDVSIRNKEKLLNKLEEEFKEAESIWNTQKEICDKRQEEDKLIGDEDYIKGLKEKVKLSDKADKVKELINTFEDILGEIDKENKKLCNLEKNLENIKNLREENILCFEEIIKEREEKLPSLKLSIEKLMESKKEKENLLKAKEDGIKLKKECIKIFEDTENCGAKLNLIEEDEGVLKENLKGKEEKKEELFVDEEFKSKINSGLFILNSYDDLDKQFNGAKNEDNKLKKDIKALKESKDRLEKNLKFKADDLNNTKSKLENLLEEIPGDNNLILNKQIKLLEHREKFNKFKDIEKSLKESLKARDSFLEKLKKLKGEKLLLQKEVEDLKSFIEHLEIEKLANKLRENLVEGECCPVCGSTHHEFSKSRNVNLDKSSEKVELLEDKEERLKNISLEISKIEATLEYEDNKIREFNKSIEEVGYIDEETLESLEREFNALKKNIDEFNLSRENLEKALEKLKEEKNDLENAFNKSLAVLCEKISREKELDIKLGELNKEMDIKSSKLDSIRTSLGIYDIKKENEAIIKKEREKNLLEKDIKNLRLKLDTLGKTKNELREKRDKLKEDYLRKKSSLSSKIEFFREKERMIKESLKGLVCEDIAVEKIDIEGLLNKLNLDIYNIETSYLKLSKEKEKLDDNFNDANKEVAVTKERLNLLRNRKDSEGNRLNLALEEEGFCTTLEVKESILSKDCKEKFNILIENHDKNLIKVRANIDLLIKKLGGRALKEEEWKKIIKDRDELEKGLKEEEEVKIRISTEVCSMEKVLEKRKSTLEIKAKQEYKLSLLNDLEKLFKGKKFVEYIATNKLRYISVEASKKLKEITNGTYGLEVDENGKFIIRDYKNGGAKREASTLSGGETFLASLALALSLSSQIQLKGTSPLELFFLDEGFGTLDDNLLDVVMGSLERLHNERLSVGIISHVESIKNRVPVKLILTPAEAGLGGSKVKIERS